VLCRVSDEPGDALAIEEDGVNTLEQFVLARYYLTTQVIAHKGRRITDAMLVRGLKLGVQLDKIDFLRRLYTFRSDKPFIDEYVKWNDERLISRLLEPEHESTWAGRFMRRLAERRLFKIVFRRPVTDFPDLVLDANRVASIAGELENATAEILSVAPEEVVFKVHRSPPTRKSEGAVLISRSSGQLEPFEARSLIFKSIDLSLREEHFECYAPLITSDEQERRRIKSDISEILTKRIQELLRPVLAPGE